MAALGATCSSFNDNFGSAGDVPVTLFDLKLCFVADPARTAATMNCGLVTPLDRKRVCFCSSTGGQSTTAAPVSTASTTTRAQATTTSSSVPPVSAGRWAAAPLGASCDTGCTALGLRCDAADFLGRNNEIDSDQEVAALFRRLLGKECTQFNNFWGSAADVPNLLVPTGVCYPSGSRPLQSISCGTSPTPDRNRLCWCSSASAGPSPPPATATTTTTAAAIAGVEGWSLASWGESCQQGCARRGLTCDVATFFRRNAEVDTEAEFAAVVTNLGGRCGWFLGDWGSAGDVPVTMASNNALCFPSASTRSLASMSCGATTGADKRRVCYCVKALALLQAEAGSAVAVQQHTADAEGAAHILPQ